MVNEQMPMIGRADGAGLGLNDSIYNRLLREIPFLRNAPDFSFDSEVLMQAAHFGFRIAEVPARTRYFDDASSIGFRDATIYGLRTLGALARLVLHRKGIWRSRRYLP